MLKDGDRKALLEGPFWAQKDGRSSHAMVALIERVRALRANDARMSIVAFDAQLAGDRDREMAEAVRNARAANATFVGLSGNIHSRRATWNELVPLVTHLVAAKLRVATYDVSASGGELWACMGTPDHEPVCGVHPMQDAAGPDAMPWTVGPARDDSHDGVYYIGKATASFPARD